MGVSLYRTDGTGLGVLSRLEKGEGAKVGGGVWLREVELLRFVLRFSRGMGEEVGRRAEEALEEEEQDGGRGEEEARFSAIAAALEQAEPGLLGTGFRFGLCREPVALVGEAMAI